MITTAQIRQIKALQSKKGREESGLFTVEGEKMVAEAVKSSFEVVDVYRIEEIGESAMARISAFSSPSPVLAVVRQKKAAVPSDLSKGLYLGLDAVRDPGNLGTIIRIADWFGIDAIFCSEDTVEVYNPKVVAGSMGAIFREKVIYCDLPSLCEKFSKVYGTFLEGETIYSAALAKDGLIVMGNEANGISSQVASKVSDKLFIPPFPRGAKTSESLNVAIATAITVSEFRRR